MSQQKHPKLNIKAARKVLLKKSLYEFVKFFWDTWDAAQYRDNWLAEYQAELFMYSVKRWLPEWITEDWISDEDYNDLKEETGGACPIRDSGCNNHDFNMPPRHSKSTTHNVAGPVWLQTIVQKEIASVSHVQDLATDFNLKRQKILNSNKFKEYFGNDEKMKIIKNSAKEISLAGGGKLFAIGMANFTGFGADLILNDDIVSSEHAKKDKEVLANAQSYWRNTLPTRRNQGDESVIWNIMQRLSPGDISGMIQSDEELASTYSRTVIESIATKDHTIIYPCSGKIKVIKKGDYLWPERFGDYSSIKAQVGSGNFETQYQQNAINSELTYIKPNDITWITYQEFLTNYKQRGSREYASFDFPVKGKDDSDKTGIVLLHRHMAKTAIVDAVEEKMGYPEQKKYVKQLNKLKPGIIQIYEDKANGSVLIQDLETEVPGIAPFNPGTKSKEQRLDIAAHYVRCGNVDFVLSPNGQKSKRLKHLEDVLTKFPFLRYDDLVDAFSQGILFVYTDSELKIYGRQFDENNIIDRCTHGNLPIDIAIHKKANKWKVLEVAQNYNNDEFIVVNEHLYTGKSQEVIPHILEIAKGKRMIYESGSEVYNLLMGHLPVEPNYHKIDPTILSVRNGLVKNKIKVMRHCKNTIADIEIFRYSRQSYDRGEPKPITLDDGFAGCLRVVVAANKGENAIFY